MELTPRQEVALYLAITFVLSLFVEIYVIRIAHSSTTPALFVLACLPGAVGLFCSWFFKHRFYDLALRSCLPEYFAYAYAVPAVASLLVLAVSICIGIGEFAFEGVKTFLRLLIFTPTLGVFMALFAAAGEELGWRGYLHTRVSEAQIPAPYLFVGLVWSTWHWPLLVFGDTSPTKLPLLSLILFTITMMSFSVFLGWLRDRSRSVFTPILAHAAHDTWMHTIYPGFYKPGPLDPFFGGDSGFLLAIIYVLVAAYIIRREENYLQV